MVYKHCRRLWWSVCHWFVTAFTGAGLTEVQRLDSLKSRERGVLYDVGCEA